MFKADFERVGGRCVDIKTQNGIKMDFIMKTFREGGYQKHENGRVGGYSSSKHPRRDRSEQNSTWYGDTENRYLLYVKFTIV